jgi:hypothetical protein
MEMKLHKVHESHEKTVWFSQRKNQPLNKKKCEIMCVNNAPGDVVPVLEIEGHEVLHVPKIKYVGDYFNNKGNNNDLINDRTTRGLICMRSTLAECGDITLGQYAIQSLVMMYKSVFVQTVMNNSGAWCGLSKENLEKIRICQMKYLKRILHTPRSTPNVAVLAELGIKPIENELHERQLNHLHHIVSLDEKDPVKMVYEEQKRFMFEKTWYLEVKNLLTMYNLEEEEDKIKEMKKGTWKNLVRKQVQALVVRRLNKTSSEGKMTRHFPQITSLTTKKYLKEMSPSEARTMFSMKAKTIDLRAVRKYMYTDPTCRLCGQMSEDIEHVLNVCTSVSRDGEVVEKEWMDDGNETQNEAVRRMKEFMIKIKEKSTTT